MRVTWAHYCRDADGTIWTDPDLERLWDWIEVRGGQLYPTWTAPAGLYGHPVPIDGESRPAAGWHQPTMSA